MSNAVVQLQEFATIIHTVESAKGAFVFYTLNKIVSIVKNFSVESLTANNTNLKYPLLLLFVINQYKSI